MLILASDGGQQEIYTYLQTVWRRYMHTRPDEIEAYFYKANPNLQNEYEIEGDTIWVKCKENYPLLWNKFVRVLRVFKDRLHEYDFICRPNLSTFFILDNYLNHLRGLPKIKTCSGRTLTHLPDIFPSGIGFAITPDIATFILTDPISNIEGIDDVIMGLVLKKLNIKTIHPLKVIYISFPNDYVKLSQEFDIARVIHFASHNRLIDDKYAHNLLLNRFYPDN
jgi:hypothetical protein